MCLIGARRTKVSLEMGSIFALDTTITIEGGGGQEAQKEILDTQGLPLSGIEGFRLYSWLAVGQKEN